MFRDRTNLYISYRRTYPHRTLPSRFETANDEERGLIGSEYRDEVDGLGEGAIEMRQLPPSLTDISADVEAILGEIESQISELGYLYKKNLLPGFNDTTAEDQKIDDLTFAITRDFQKAYSAIKKFEMIKIQFGNELKNDELSMVDNMKRNLALKTQNLSKNFRRMQNNYIKFLKQDDYENFGSLPTTQSSNAGELDEAGSSAQIESYSREALKQSQQQLQLQEQEGAQSTITDEFIEQREREIYKIAQGVIEVSTIFKELENMIIDQGTILDRIDYNLENTVVHLKEADKQLKKGERYQKQTAKCKIIMFLCLLVFLLLMLVVSRPTRTDHYIHDKPDAPNSSDSGSSDSDSSKPDSNTSLGSELNDETGIPSHMI